MLSKEEGRKYLSQFFERFKLWEAEGRLEHEDDVKDLVYELLEKVLGWDKNDIYRERHPGPTSKRADFQVKYKGDTKLILETKALYVSWDKEVIRQAVGYGWGANKDYVVLTNSNKLILFNAKWKDEDKKIFEIDIGNCLTSETNFDFLWLLSKESFLRGKIDEFSISIGKKSKKLPIETIDKQLLRDLKKWREMLTKDIKKLNKLPDDEIENIVQRIINRLIFIRVCEDRGIDPGFPELRSHLNTWSEKKNKPLIDVIISVFHHYDDIYDGIIFQKNDSCEKVKIYNNTLEKIIEELYIAKEVEVEYNFASIDADVLGSVYEEYLGYILKGKKITEDHAHRKEQGIYYTPTYIVDYIVKNTLGEILKRNKDIDKIKVLDPACGSGSFLIKAFDIISEFWKEKIGEEKFNREIKNNILTNNLYGVDLDNKAVEIAQLNLLLKIGEKGQLPKLRENIKCGNSLIDDKEVAGEKAFKWEEKFEEIIDDGGFDVVIGNPPYIRIQTLPKDEVEFYNENYKSATKSYDIYILFIEKGFSLLKENGVLGLILPHKFFQGEMGEKIRRYLYETKSVYKIVDFTTNQVFENATTYTCLLFLSKKPNKYFLYKRFRLGENFKDLQNVVFEKKDIKILRNDKWNFSDSEVQKVLSKIFHQKNCFTDITEKIFKGSSTGDDDVFLLDPVKENNKTFTVFSIRLNKNIEIEKELLHPFVYGENIRRYGVVKSKKLLLFPYVLQNNEMKLISPEEMKKKYPLAYEYFNKLRNDLTKRKIETNGSNFYKFSAARSLMEYNRPKIMIPDMLVSNRISYDEKGAFYHGPAIHSIVFNEKIKGQNPFLYLAILNSKLFWFFISNTSTALRGNAYRLTPEFLNSFCFPAFDLNKKHDCEIHDEIVILVKKMFSLNNRLSIIGDKKIDEKQKIEEEINQIDKEIDQKVYELYGLTPEEIKIVESS